jgi:hypothetical protein
MIRFASYDPVIADLPVRLNLAHGSMHRLSLAEAIQLHEELGGAIMQCDPRDTILPPPPADSEPDTLPSTPDARRASSGTLAAVDLSDTVGLAARVSAELAEGRAPSPPPGKTPAK